MDAQKLIEKLQGDGANSLAALSIDSLLNTEIGGLVSPAFMTSAARQVLTSWLASDGALMVTTRVVERVANQLQTERRAVKDLAPRDFKQVMREVLERPFSPDRRLVLTIIDRPPTRELVRQLLLDAILDFGRKASAPVAGMARGLGSLAKLAGESVKARSGGFGSLVGAVSGEVERQLEKRAVEFVDAALGGVFGQIADAISDPKRAEEAAELRLAFFDGVMELTGPQLSRELMNLDVTGGAKVLREGMSKWLATPESETTLSEFATRLLEHDGKRSVREVLAEVGLLDVAKSIAVEQLAVRIKAITATTEFAAWLAS